MRIAEFLHPEAIVPDLQGNTRDAVLMNLADTLASLYKHKITPQAIAAAFLAREELGSTGVGEGVAIPHAKMESVDRLLAAFGRVPAGVPYGALDQKPVMLFFALLVPESATVLHVKALARVARVLRNPVFREQVIKLNDAHAMYNAFVEADQRA